MQNTNTAHNRLRLNAIYSLAKQNRKNQGVKNFTLVTRWIRFQPMLGQTEPTRGDIT